MDTLCWKEYWILTKESQFYKVENEFWKRATSDLYSREEFTTGASSVEVSKNVSLS